MTQGIAQSQNSEASSTQNSSRLETSNRERGDTAEDLAIEFLLSHNHSFIQRNFYSRFGEIDIIVRDLATGDLVFVEVKSGKYFDPMENMTQRKLGRIYRTIHAYTVKRFVEQPDFRVDIILVANGKIEWLKGEML